MLFTKPASRFLIIMLISSTFLFQACSYIPWIGDDDDSDDLAFDEDFNSEYDYEGEAKKVASGTTSSEDDFFADDRELVQGALSSDNVNSMEVGDFASLDQSNQGNELRGDLETLQMQQEALISRVRELQEIVQNMEPRLSATQSQLETSMVGATGSTVQLEPEIDSLKLEVSRLQSEIDTMKQSEMRVAPVKTRQASATMSKSHSGGSSKTPAAYNRALDAYRSGNYDESILLFQELSTQSHPASLKDNIAFWIGSNYKQLEMYDDAISHFETVLRDYPSGNKVHDARLLLGMSLYKKGDTGRALDILDVALKSNPPADVRMKIERQLKLIK